MREPFVRRQIVVRKVLMSSCGRVPASASHVPGPGLAHCEADGGDEAEDDPRVQ
jgi:hypothetical protein